MVLAHLARALPDKTDAERRKIAWRFYRNFLDYFMETVKMISSGRNYLARHFAVDNPSMYLDLLNEGKRVQLQVAHLFNWEFANNWIPYTMNQPFIVLYMPLSNKVMNRLFLFLRTKTGTTLVPATDARNAMLPFRSQNYMLTLLADQAPGSASNAYWLNFFGEPAGFVRAPERGARAGDTPVIFVKFYKTGRGKYRARLEMASNNPRLLPEGELTRRYVTFLEKSIREQPEIYLWTHNRWKHNYKPEYGRFWIGPGAPPQPQSKA
jgi:KDO2-lipid IV(A) lauroyltransferase